MLLIDVVANFFGLIFLKIFNKRNEANNESNSNRESENQFDTSLKLIVSGDRIIHCGTD